MPRSLTHIAALLLLAGAAWALSDDEVTVDYRDGTYYGSLRLRTPASPAVVMAVLTDFERMPEFMPGLTSSRIVARHHNQYQVGACKNFCVNGHLAGNCRAPRSDDGRSKESSTEGVAGQPAG